MSRSRIRYLVLLGAFAVAIAAALALAAAGLPIVGREKHWSIGIYAGPSPFELTPASAVNNPVMSAADVTDVPARFVADPFMIRREATWYMFFEVLNQKSGLGEIAMAVGADALHWSYGGVVIQEPFHLSYPYVFAAGDDFYLVPESGAAQEVRLYRATQFPRRWELAGSLLTGAPYVDASLVQYGGYWWIFVQSQPLLNDTLRLYFAEDLHGPWSEHRLSPIVHDDPHRSRPGGRVFLSEARLYRLAQDDAPHYGARVWAFEITELSPSRYAERPLASRPVIGPAQRGWNADGMHHVDPHQLGADSWIACVDGYRNGWRIGPWFW